MSQLARHCLLLLAWLGGSTAVAAAEMSVHEYRLDNGMRVVVKEDHRAPVVVSQVWYAVGSSYEHSGMTGISHVLEHMMFKGTEKHPEGEFSEIIARNGGEENAFTGRDYTAYYEVLASDRLEVAFELEADRMVNLRMQEADFRNELEVVKEERRLRTEDEPDSLTYEHFKATAFLNSPYGLPVIGWMTDLEHLTLKDLEAWYEAWYAPNNATLVVVGDVDPEAVHKLAAKHFGPLEPAEHPELNPRREVEQRGERRLSVKAPAEVPYLVMGYKVPVLKTAEDSWEPYALEVLAGILDGGRSARLSRELVRGRELLASAGASYSLASRLDRLFLLEATPAQGHDVAEAEEALLSEIKRLRNEPVAPEELERVKAQVVASEVYERDSVQHQAIQLGLVETLGLGWQVLEAYPDKIRAVTADQVQAVARKYLVPERLTVAVLEPQPMEAEDTGTGGAEGSTGE